MNAALRNFNNNATCIGARRNYLESRKKYRAILKAKKRAFHDNLNHQLEHSKKGQLNCSTFKKMKQNIQEDILFDDFDIETFYNFFKNLYTDAQPIESTRREQLKHEATSMINNQLMTDPLVRLNDNITHDELSAAIKNLSNGKSVSLDLISNEMLKNLRKDMLDAVLTLFNLCLKHGTYPWTSSTITPMPKGGDPYNPDNYRAIALGSCIGKLFSSILLTRINIFRADTSPEHPNQLGFKKGAQTADHLLTLKTLIDKYTTKHKKKLYVCFVDFRKAFDSVAREALLYKIAKLGIGGNIFKTLKYMYENTSTRVKLIKKLSEHINLSNGVEQGHPLSPELFKIFIHERNKEFREKQRINFLPFLQRNI